MTPRLEVVGDKLVPVAETEALVRIDTAVWAAARAEAARRGVDPSVVVEEALRRHVAGEDLRRLLGELDARLGPAERLGEEEAMRIAAEELAAHRRERRS